MATTDRAATVARLQQRAVDYAVERPVVARLWRTAARYVDVRVARLAAFVTYYGFLAMFPLTALAVSVLGILSRYVPALDDAVVGALDDNVDRLGLDPQLLDQLQRAAVGLGLISLGFLLYAGVRWIEALREALALTFGGEPPRGRIVGRVLADLVLLVLLGAVLLATILLSTITVVSAGWLADLLDLSASEGLLRLAAGAVSLLASIVLLGLVMARLAGRPVRKRLLVQGAVVGGIGFEALRLGATLIIGQSLKNPVYGVFAVTIGLLVWINFASKWLLVVSAWVAVADDPGLGTGLVLPGASGGGDEALTAELVATPSAHRQEPDGGTRDEQGSADPASDRPR
ncbi:MAG TPA: YihY/virulence factor BrkB family protein [Candidatus Limnocylindria bacterium]|nr:YihY/virulence factor BrkB family protein [Candidatus Limnocylindria bacterium]